MWLISSAQSTDICQICYVLFRVNTLDPVYANDTMHKPFPHKNNSDHQHTAEDVMLLLKRIKEARK